MPDVLAVVSKAVFDKEAKAHALDTGVVWPTDRYASAGKGLSPLAGGGRLFLVTVRPPSEALWLIAILDQPTFDGAAWIAEPNTTAIRDLSSLKSKITFANGAGLPDKPGVLGMSLQTPRLLSEETAALLSGGTSENKTTKTAKTAKTAKTTKPTAAKSSPKSAPRKPAKPGGPGAQHRSTKKRCSHAGTRRARRGSPTSCAAYPSMPRGRSDSRRSSDRATVTSSACRRSKPLPSSPTTRARPCS